MTRAGRWVDFDHDYKTMDPTFMESIWWVFKKLWEKGLIYEGAKVLPYSPALATVLSNNEVNLGGYKDVNDPAITIRFRLKGDAKGKAVHGPHYDQGGHAYILAWTTTPWTLPSNLALAVGPDIDYVKVRDGNDLYILAESRLATYWPHGPEGKKTGEGATAKVEGAYQILGTVKGSELAACSRISRNWMPRGLSASTPASTSPPRTVRASSTLRRALARRTTRS